MNQKRINNDMEIILYLLRKPAHGREISENIKIPLTTIQRALKTLENKNILDVMISGKNKLYQLKKGIHARNYIYMAELYKTTRIIEKYPFLGTVIDEVIKKGGFDIAVIFGSYAKMTAKKGSDIDIYIDAKDSKVKKDVEGIGFGLSVKTGEFNPLSPLVKEIIKNHVMIKGVERFYEKSGFFEED